MINWCFMSWRPKLPTHEDLWSFVFFFSPLIGVQWRSLWPVGKVGLQEGVLWHSEYIYLL
jgi:hypothetical protein